jgi:hypothetical protein
MSILKEINEFLEYNTISQYTKYYTIICKLNNFLLMLNKDDKYILLLSYVEWNSVNIKRFELDNILNKYTIPFVIQNIRNDKQYLEKTLKLTNYETKYLEYIKAVQYYLIDNKQEINFNFLLSFIDLEVCRQFIDYLESIIL